MDATRILQGAMTLMVALSWNQATRSGINYVYPMPTDQVRADILYAIIVTITIILIIIIYNHLYKTSDLFKSQIDFISPQTVEKYTNKKKESLCNCCKTCAVPRAPDATGQNQFILNDYSG